MPGPLHGGILRAEQWNPGAGVAGTPQRREIGSFSEDMVLVGLYIQEGTGAVTSTGKLYLGKSGSGAKYTVIDEVFTNSPLYNAALAGGRVELGVYIPAGEQCIFEVNHTGTDALKWLILLAPPPVTRQGVESIIRALQGQKSSVAPSVGPATFSK
jgi:hypothetical protein